MDRPSDLTSRRSIGITLLAIFLVLQGAFEFLGISAVFVSFDGTFATALGIINLMITLAVLVLAWGTWTLKPWAFWIGVVEVLSLGVRFFTLFQPNANVPSLLLRMVFPLFILVWVLAIQKRRIAS
jgi:hypothetical protein